MNLVLATGGHRHAVAADVVDRSHARRPVLVGGDVLGRYRLRVGRRADESRGRSRTRATRSADAASAGRRPNHE